MIQTTIEPSFATASLEERIPLYLQAQRTIERHTRLVIEPFEEAAKERGEKQVYLGDGLDVRLETSLRQQKMSPKRVVDELGVAVKTMLANQRNGKRAYGVRDFDGVVAIDASYLRDQYETWRTLIVDETTVDRILYKPTKEAAAAARRVADEHLGRLLGDARLDVTEGVRHDDAALYVAAKEQVDALGALVASVEKEAKRSGPRAKRTTWTRREYGEFFTQVMTVPREEPDYEATADRLGATLERAATAGPTAADGVTLFWNDDLDEPRMYIAGGAILATIELGKERTQTKYRQSLDVYYKPAEALVVALR